MKASLQPRAYRHAFAITPHATDPVNPGIYGILATVGGNINVRLEDSDADIVIPIVANVILPLAITHVRAASTTATGLIGLR